MKTSLLRFAIAICAAGAAASSYGQYSPSTPTSGYRAPVYAPYAATAPAQPAQPTAYRAATNQGRGRPQFTAARPTAPAYGLQPSANAYVAPRPTQQVAPAPQQVAVPSFRPVNPPSANTRRILTASRTPTPAPPQVRPVSATAQAGQPSGGAMWQPSMNAQDWNAPMPSMPAQTGPGGYGPQSQATMQGGDYSGGGAVGGGDCGDGGCAPACGHGGCLRGCCCGLLHGCCGCCCIPLRSTGDMVQHMPFFGTTHGYYYMRPYHVMHVFSQQELTTRWGGDPRNPYDNGIFQRVYEQLGVDAKSITPTPNTVPSNLLPPSMQQYSAPQPTMPTPVPSYQPMPNYQPVPQDGPVNNGSFTPGTIVPTPSLPGGSSNAPIEFVPGPT